MIRNRARKSLAALASALLALLEIPLALVWALGPGLIWRDNPLTGALGHPAAWLYDQYVKGDENGWPDR